MPAGSAGNTEIQGVGNWGCWDLGDGCQELEIWDMSAGSSVLGSW